MSYTNGITSSPLLQTLLTQTDAASQTKNARPGSVGAGAAQDSAQLSTVASALQQTAAEDPVRASKVQALQAAVANGTYHVSSDEVADKMVRTLLQS